MRRTTNEPVGHERAAARLRAARGSVYRRVRQPRLRNRSFEEAVDHLAASPAVQALPEADRGKVVGVALAFAMTAVESERKLRRLGRWWGVPMTACAEARAA